MGVLLSLPLLAIPSVGTVSLSCARLGLITDTLSSCSPSAQHVVAPQHVLQCAVYAANVVTGMSPDTNCKVVSADIHQRRHSYRLCSNSHVQLDICMDHAYPMGN